MLALKIDDSTIKIDQVQTLMGVLIEYRDIPKRDQDNIIHIAFDILSDQKKELLEVSAALLKREQGEQKGNKTFKTS